MLKNQRRKERELGERAGGVPPPGLQPSGCETEAGKGLPASAEPGTWARNGGRSTGAPFAEARPGPADTQPALHIPRRRGGLGPDRLRLKWARTRGRRGWAVGLGLVGRSERKEECGGRGAAAGNPALSWDGSRFLSESSQHPGPTLPWVSPSSRRAGLRNLGFLGNEISPTLRGPFPAWPRAAVVRQGPGAVLFCWVGGWWASVP